MEYKVGSLACSIMDLDPNTPKHLGNGHQWELGYEAGYNKAKNEAALKAVRFEGYTNRVETLLHSARTELHGLVPDGYTNPNEVDVLSKAKQEFLV